MIKLVDQTSSGYFKIVRKELYDAGIDDISAADAFVLLNLETDKTASNALRNKIGQMGCNLNAIIRNLAQKGYVCSERSRRDRRVVEIWLSDKGRTVADRLTKMHNRLLGSVATDSASKSAIRTLRNIEEFWIDQLLD